MTRPNDVDSEAFFAIVAAIVCALFLVYLATHAAVGALAESACLHAGYREATVSYAFDRYCVKRQDQTDVVVPFAEAVQ